MPVEELEVLRAWHPNLLISGSAETIAPALESVKGVLRPVITKWVRAASMPPVDGIRTVIIHDVDLLSCDDQKQLLAWLKQDFCSVQIVATTTRSLLELVESATFDASLYYALNVIYIELPS
jgi:hypothetical protein